MKLVGPREGAAKSVRNITQAKWRNPHGGIVAYGLKGTKQDSMSVRGIHPPVACSWRNERRPLPSYYFDLGLGAKPLCQVNAQLFELLFLQLAVQLSLNF